MTQSRYLRLGKYTTGLPSSFFQPIYRRYRDLPHSEKTVRQIIEVIRRYFSYRHYVTTTHDVRKSRLVAVKKILKTRLRTCGSIASVSAATFRRLGYPTKLIDGRLRQGQGDVRHAWIEVQLDQPKTWLAIDPSRGSGHIGKIYHRLGAYSDWSQLHI